MSKSIDEGVKQYHSTFQIDPRVDYRGYSETEWEQAAKFCCVVSFQPNPPPVPTVVRALKRSAIVPEPSPPIPCNGPPAKK